MCSGSRPNPRLRLRLPLSTSPRQQLTINLQRPRRKRRPHRNRHRTRRRSPRRPQPTRTRARRSSRRRATRWKLVVLWKRRRRRSLPESCYLYVSTDCSVVLLLICGSMISRSLITLSDHCHIRSALRALRSLRSSSRHIRVPVFTGYPLFCVIIGLLPSSNGSASLR